MAPRSDPRRRTRAEPAVDAARVPGGALPAPDADETAEHERLQEILASPSYRMAFEDADFIMRPELRPVRLQLELMKPEITLRQHRIRSTVVVFGSTRIAEPGVARARVEALEREVQERGPDPMLEKQLGVARRILAKSRYYDEARAFGRLVSQAGQGGGPSEYVVITGGGPGIMEAANRGAFEAGAKSIGLNITLPHEQRPNSFITPELCFQFHYFAIRKLHFMLRAKALVAFPGGFGTIDELFEALTLLQTHKARALPVILFGREFWENAVHLRFLADEGTISEDDLELIRYAETAAEAWDMILRYHANRRGNRTARSTSSAAPPQG